MDKLKDEKIRNKMNSFLKYLLLTVFKVSKVNN